MKKYCWLLATCMLAVSLAAQAQAGGTKAPGPVPWKKIVIDKTFHSEGVAVADVNKDGKNDILVGDLWYEAPSWKKHVIRKGPNFKLKGYDGSKGYSQSFACWADDINKDGWADLIVIGFPGAPCHWYENPQNKPGTWKEHFIWHSACNETPQYVDLFKNGKRVLIMGWQPKGQQHMGQMAWFAPDPKDTTRPWIMHPISEPSRKGHEIPGTFKYSHGLGVGDVNGDRRLDVICTGGWWEQPGERTKKPWTFHPANLGPACADMHTQDLDGDNVPDIISSSAHNFGIWWHRQTPKTNGTKFVRRNIMSKLFSQSHALHLIDINGDGLKDLVTGRRHFAHQGHDPGGKGPAYLYWFEAKKNKDGTIRFIPYKIDDDSGIGTQFVVTDFNGDGKPDIIVSNKSGVFLTLQVSEVRSAPPARKE